MDSLPTQTRCQQRLTDTFSPEHIGLSQATRVFPLINPREPEGLWHFWPEVESHVIAINYIGLKKNPGLLSLAQSVGIKEALGYGGKVVAVLIGENWELEKTDIREYASDLDQMGFDFGTASDDYVYPDDPMAAQWDRVQCMLDDADELVKFDPNASLIGVVQGSTRQQIRFEMTHLAKMGIERMALTSADTAQRRKFRGIVDFLGIGAEMGVWRWLIGINSPALMLRFKADAMSGYAWLYMAAKGYIYRGPQLVRANEPGFCRHDVCRMLAWKGLNIAELRARHNALTLVELNERMKEGERLE